MTWDRQPVKKYSRKFYVLAWFAFTTDELGLDYYHQKLNVGVTLRVAKWLETEDFRKWENVEKSYSWVLV